MKNQLILCFLGVAVAVLLTGIPRTVDIDSHSYLLMAEGRLEDVVRPYSGRILHPLIAGTVQRSLEGVGVIPKELSPRPHGSEAEKRAYLEKKWACSFCVIAGVALTIFLVSLCLLLKESVPKAGWFALFFSPVLALSVVNIYLPDLFFAALLALWFLALFRQQRLTGAAVLFLLVMTRESSLLVGLVYCGFYGVKREWRLALLGGIAMVCGMLAVQVLTRDARPNIHEIGGLSYLALKMVSNSLANFLGVTLWTNTYASTLPHFYPDPPIWKMIVPAWLQGGAVQEVGIYRFDFGMPFRTVLALLTTFGLLTVTGWLLLRKEGWQRLKELPDVFQLALIVGLAFFVLGPMSGRSVERLVGYAWPAFWLAIPMLAKQSPERASFYWRSWFWGCHVIISWSAILIRQ